MPVRIPPLGESVMNGFNTTNPTTETKARLTGRGALAAHPYPAPTEERLPDGQHKDHWILPDEERDKGFVHPVRTQYRHVGIRPTYPLRALTEAERERFLEFEYAYRNAP